MPDVEFLVDNFFSFRTLNMSSHLLASMVSDEKWVLNLTEETLYVKRGHLLFSPFPLCHWVLII